MYFKLLNTFSKDGLPDMSITLQKNKRWSVDVSSKLTIPLKRSVCKLEVGEVSSMCTIHRKEYMWKGVCIQRWNYKQQDAVYIDDSTSTDMKGSGSYTCMFVSKRKVSISNIIVTTC